MKRHLKQPAYKQILSWKPRRKRNTKGQSRLIGKIRNKKPQRVIYRINGARRRVAGLCKLSRKKQEMRARRAAKLLWRARTLMTPLRQWQQQRKPKPRLKIHSKNMLILIHEIQSSTLQQVSCRDSGV